MLHQVSLNLGQTYNINNTKQEFLVVMQELVAE